MPNARSRIKKSASIVFLLYPKSASHGAILLRILNCQSSNNTRFLSIISPILSIYWETSFTFSLRLISPSGYTLLEMLPAPQATMVCTSSIMIHTTLIMPYYQVLSSILYFYNHPIKVLFSIIQTKFDVLLMYFHQICCTLSIRNKYECLKGFFHIYY